MSETRLIEYIGKQANRVDDVLRTRRIWPAAGSVLEIPAAEAPRYTEYPTEWRETTREELEQRKDLKQAARDTAAKLLALADKLPATDLREVADALRAEALKREQTEDATRSAESAQRVAEAKAREATAEVTGQHADTSGGEGSEYTQKRLDDIVNAAREIDLNDSEKTVRVDYGNAVVPTPEALLPYLTFRPTEAEIVQALVPAPASAPEVNTPPEPAKELTRTEKAQSALADLPAAERPTLLRMIEVFELGLKNQGSLDVLRGRVRAALERIADGAGELAEAA